MFLTQTVERRRNVAKLTSAIRVEPPSHVQRQSIRKLGVLVDREVGEVVVASLNQLSRSVGKSSSISWSASVVVASAAVVGLAQPLLKRLLRRMSSGMPAGFA